MDEDEKARWVAWVSGQKGVVEAERGFLPALGAITGNILWHGGTLSHMTLAREPVHVSEFDPRIHSAHTLVVLKEYGHFTSEEADDVGLFDLFHGDFPPKECSVPDLLETCAGWVSPRGKLYACAYSGHTQLANRLSRVFQIKDLEASFSRMDDLLVKQGWLRVSHNLIARDWERNKPMTQKQKDVLFDIVVVVEDEWSDDKLAAQLKKTCEHELKLEEELYS